MLSWDEYNKEETVRGKPITASLYADAPAANGSETKVPAAAKAEAPVETAVKTPVKSPAESPVDGRGAGP